MEKNQTDQFTIAERARQARIVTARSEINTFLELVLKDEFSGNTVIQAPCHEIWHEACDIHDRVLLYAHRESGKTTQMAVGRPLFELGKNPDIRIAIISNTFRQAEKIVRNIANYIETNEMLRLIFPRLIPGEPWTSSAITVRSERPKRDPSVQAIGVHGQVLGARIDLAILDDILSFENTMNPSQRRDLYDWYHATIVGTLTRHARVIIIGTAWHPDDMLHRFEKQTAVWHTMRFPLIDSKGAAAWPEAWPQDRITRKRVELGPTEFARQMMCKARDDSESRFKQEWMDACLEAGDKCCTATTASEFYAYHPDLAPASWLDEVEEVDERIEIVEAIAKLTEGVEGGFLTGVDLGVQRNASADETVIFTIFLHPNNFRQVVEVQAGKWTGPEIVAKIINVHRRFGSIVCVENNSCFPEGTLVLTKTGYKPIENIKIGELVWTHNNRWRAVKDLIKGQSRTKVTAQGKGCLPVETTPNHWFYMREAGRIKGSYKNPDVGKHRPTGKAQWISYGFRDKAAYTAIAVPKWPKKKAQIILRKTTRDCSKRIVIDENFAVVLGLFMAEGHTTRSQVTWTLSSKEQHLAQFIQQTVQEKIGCKVRVTVGSTPSTLRVIANSAALADALKCGVGTKKCLPIKWLGWPLELRLAIVRGWLLGDGNISVINKTTNHPSFVMRGTSISRNWMLFARTTLSEAELSTSLRIGRRGAQPSIIEGRVINRNQIYNLLMSRSATKKLKQQMTLDVERIHWHTWWEQDKIKGYKDHRGQLLFEDGHAWAKVPSIEQDPYTQCNQTVYNLVVEEDESFTVEDFIVHNAQDFILQFVLEQGPELIPLVPFTTGKNKANPTFGIEALATEFANHRWIIPSKGKEATDPQIRLWIEEMLYYDPKAHTGDRLMASWFARELARRVAGAHNSIGVQTVG